LERVVNQAGVDVLRAGAMERRPVEVSEGMGEKIWLDWLERGG
jgi:hypothetical protein